MSKKLEILTKSLEKKEAQFNAKIEAHFTDVRSANRQPLNDKRNGQATLNRWERQDDSLRTLRASIEKTKEAIEAEKGKIFDVEATKKVLPPQIVELIEAGILVQWRKHPHILFVAGVDKARIIWDSKKKVVAHKFTLTITDKEQYKKFVSVFNPLGQLLNTTSK